MLQTSDADRFLEGLAHARVAGDLEASLDFFHDNADFAIPGVVAPIKGRDAIRALLKDLINQFEFLEWKRIQTFVNGGEIAARHHLRLRHGPSGRVADTETCEFLTMRDGRCGSFVQFVDTALVADLGRA